MSKTGVLHEFPFMRSAATLCSCAALGLVVTGIVLVPFDPDWFALSGVACALCLVPALGVLFSIKSMERRPDALGMTFLVGGVARMFVTLVILILTQRYLPWDRPVVAGAVAGWYLYLLAAEVVLLARFLATHEFQVKGGAA
jgi:hypothetical protein